MRWGIYLRRYRIRIMLVAGYFLSLGYSYWIEPHWLWVSRLPVTPPAANGRVILVAQLSDMHFRKFGYLENSLVAQLQALKPDLIVMTGDMVVTEASLPLLEEFLAAIRPIAPVLATRGNWEHYINYTLPQYKELYGRHGARLLNNESVTLTFGDHTVLVTGLDDGLHGDPSLFQALRGVEPAANHLVLIHSPDYYDMLPAFVSAINAKRKDGPSFHPTLVLAGHTHGGQVTFFGYAIKTAPGSADYVNGWYGEGWPRLYVSRGIGTSILPLRFFAPPELALFEWTLQ